MPSELRLWEDAPSQVRKDFENVEAVQKRLENVPRYRLLPCSTCKVAAGQLCYFEMYPPEHREWHAVYDVHVSREFRWQELSELERQMLMAARDE